MLLSGNMRLSFALKCSNFFSPQEYLDGEGAGFQHKAWGKGISVLLKSIQLSVTFTCCHSHQKA